MIRDNVPFRVLLPEWIWKEALDKQDFKRLLTSYMESYPHYVVKTIEKPFVLCERRD
jgi:hypothetical protein